MVLLDIDGHETMRTDLLKLVCPPFTAAPWSGLHMSCGLSPHPLANTLKQDSTWTNSSWVTASHTCFHLFVSIITFNKIENGHKPMALKPPTGPMAPSGYQPAPAQAQPPAPLALAQPQLQLYSKCQTGHKMKTPTKEKREHNKHPE